MTSRSSRSETKPKGLRSGSFWATLRVLLFCLFLSLQKSLGPETLCFFPEGRERDPGKGSRGQLRLKYKEKEEMKKFKFRQY